MLQKNKISQGQFRKKGELSRVILQKGGFLRVNFAKRGNSRGEFRKGL